MREERVASLNNRWALAFVWKQGAAGPSKLYLLGTREECIALPQHRFSCLEKENSKFTSLYSAVSTAVYNETGLLIWTTAP